MARTLVIANLVANFGFKVDKSGISDIDSAISSAQRRTSMAGTEFIKWGLGATGAATGAVAAFASVESELAKIVGLVGVNRDVVMGWRGDIEQISSETGQSTNELARALFFITSAGLRGSEAIDVLRSSAQASAAGLGDQAVVADLLTSAVNAYGAEVLSAADATDALVNAIRLGKLEPATLATAMGRALPLASAFGVEFHEVAGILAAMSRTGTNAEEAVTQVRSALQTFIRPTNEAEEALEGVGLTIEELRTSLGEQGFLRTILRIRTAFNDNNIAMGQVFPNIRAMAGLMDLLGPGLDTNIALLDEMTRSTGVTGEAFAAAADTINFRWGRATTMMMNRVIAYGERVAPFATQFIDMVDQVGERYDALDEDTKQMLAQAALLGPILLGLGVGLKAVAFAMGPFKVAAVWVGALASGAGLAVPTLGVIAITLGAVAAALALVVWWWRPLSTFLMGLKDGVGSSQELRTAWNELRDAGGELWGAVEPLYRKFRELTGAEAEATDQGVRFGEALAESLADTLRLITLIVNGIESIASAADAASDWMEDSPLLLPGTARARGEDTGNAFKEGLINAIPGLRQVVRAMTQDVDDYLPHSDAKIGPLSNLTESGRSLPRTLARGIGEDAHALDRAMSRIVDAAARPLPVGPAPAPAWAFAGAGAAAQGAMGAGRHVTIDVGGIRIYVADGDPEEIMRMLDQKLVERWRAVAEEFDTDEDA